MGNEILLEREGAVAVVTLNRPDKLNAVNLGVLNALRDVLEVIRADLTLRAVVFRGAGKAFCAGADLEYISPIVSDEEAFGDFLKEWHATYDAVAGFELPTIAAVHGVALAGGLELVQVCDLVVAAKDARLGDQHARYGLYPGGGSTQRLARQIPIRHATWLLFSGEWVNGVRASELGLVNEAVDSDKVFERAMEMATTLAGRSPAATAAIKHAMAVGLGKPVAQALALDLPIALEHMASEDAQIGLDAFRQRAEPQWRRR